MIPGPSGNSPVLQAPATGAYQLAELVVDLLQAQVQTYILTALQNVRAQRLDNTVTTEAPRSYFTYEEAEVYRAPAIFTIIQDTDVRPDVQKANHVNALSRVIVAAVVEDRTKELVVKKAWRYQAALMQLLHLVRLTTADRTLSLFSRVKTCSFSPVVRLKDPKASDAVFRQEMSLTLNVEHIENLQ